MQIAAQERKHTKSSIQGGKVNRMNVPSDNGLQFFDEK